MIRIIQFRAGAPDKFNLFHKNNIELIKYDHKNLVDFTDYQVRFEFDPDSYLLPADEGDIKHANTLTDQSHILLPKTSTGDVIDYMSYVPKDSKFYQEMNLELIKYPAYKVYSLEDFKKIDYRFHNNCVLKTTTGSGSRGVWVIDHKRTHLGNKCVSELTPAQYQDFIDFCTKENCDIIVQELCNINYKKCNVDFIIRDGELLTYKWTLMNQSQQFTNWDNGEFIKNEFTDKVMKEFMDYLINVQDIKDAIMNFECYSDLSSEVQLVEMNWRYSNSMFEFQALGEDPLDIYFTKRHFDVSPIKFTRYWQCMPYYEIEDPLGFEINNLIKKYGYERVEGLLKEVIKNNQ